MIALLFLSRFFLGGVGFIAQFFPYRADFWYTSPTAFFLYPEWAQRLGLTTFANFDGVHYVSIAVRGYIDEGRFFPGWPLLLRAVSAPVLESPIMVLGLGMLLSFVLTGLLLAVWEKVFLLEETPERVRRSLLLFLAFPSSFFLFALYSEAFFVLATGCFLYFLGVRRYWLALIAATVALSIRFVGIALLPILIWEWSRWVRTEGLTRGKIGQLISVSIALLPLALFAHFCWQKWDDPLFFLNAHALLGNSRESAALVFPLQTVIRYFKILFTISPQIWEWWVALLELVSVGVWTVGSVLLLLQRRSARLILYTFGIVALPLFSGTFTGFPRYLLVCLPVFLAISQGVSKKVFVGIVGCSLILQWVLFFMFSRGFFIA